MERWPFGCKKASLHACGHLCESLSYDWKKKCFMDSQWPLTSEHKIWMLLNSLRHSWDIISYRFFFFFLWNSPYPWQHYSSHFLYRFRIHFSFIYKYTHTRTVSLHTHTHTQLWQRWMDSKKTMEYHSLVVSMKLHIYGLMREYTWVHLVEGVKDFPVSVF